MAGRFRRRPRSRSKHSEGHILPLFGTSDAEQAEKAEQQMRAELELVTAVRRREHLRYVLEENRNLREEKERLRRRLETLESSKTSLKYR